MEGRQISARNLGTWFLEELFVVLAGLFEGDIAGVDTSSKALATLNTLYVTYWPNGVIPYVFADNTYSMKLYGAFGFLQFGFTYFHVILKSRVSKSPH